MKINESTLAAFATSPNAPADKEGWLWKKGEVNKAFQKRYFVLKGNLLFYFERPSDKEPAGVIILEGCIVELAEEDTDRFGFKISFHQVEASRVYHLGTEFQQTLMEWMRLLACASHDYMKLMVLELQQKLLELDESAASGGQPPPAEALSDADRMPVGRNPFAKEDGGLPAAPCPKSGDPGSPDCWSEQHKAYSQRILSDYHDYLSKL